MPVSFGAFVMAIRVGCVRRRGCVPSRWHGDLFLLIITADATARFSAGGGATELKIAGGGHTDEGVRM